MIALFPHCGFLSETSRMLAIHDALRAQGEAVCIATHGGPWESLLDRAGLRWTQLGPRMDTARCARFIQSLPGIGPPTQSMYSDAEMLAYARAEADFMRERGIRLAVAGFTLTTLLSSRLAGIPLATSHAGSFVPPVCEAGLVPIPSRPTLPTMGIWPRSWQRRFMNWSPARASIYCSGFNRAARTLGVEGVPSFAALLLGDLTLVTDVPEILGVDRATMEGWHPAPGARYRAGTTLRYTGPLYARLELPVPERVEQFLAHGTVVYVALTSTTPALLRAVVAAARRCGAKLLVSGTVHELRDLEGPALMVEPLLPSHRIMPRVAAAVTAGGQGSVQTAVAAGIPLVGVPLQPEQDLNVDRLACLGMAQRIAPQLAGTEALTRALRSALDEPRWRDNARRPQAIVANIDGPAEAAAAIRGYLGTQALTAGVHHLSPQALPAAAG